jgi:hypothetical protein
VCLVIDMLSNGRPGLEWNNREDEEGNDISVVVRNQSHSMIQWYRKVKAKSGWAERESQLMRANIEKSGNTVCDVLKHTPDTSGNKLERTQSTKLESHADTLGKCVPMMLSLREAPPFREFAPG